MSEIIRPNKTEAILYEPAAIARVGDSLFDPAAWSSSEPVGTAAGGGGRGRAFFVSSGETSYVLKHYFRGGVPRRILHDRYFWLGAHRTRSFREFHLLEQLQRWNLPAPAPAAARFQRSHLIYRADILTERLPDVRSFSEILADRQSTTALWHRVGQTIREFHERGVCHADLNAHNIQVARNGGVYLLDFDRGSIKDRGSWGAKNLGRLQRSLQKISRLDERIEFSAREWGWVMAGYAGSSIGA